ncbi:hypothetical protein [Paenibacillus sp. FSL H7-0331]|uniref:hypothetical protein n=1 Tax=Paenibacillus sp. FSL H7-0331 TaxID=1920421 RepID=UPI00096EB49F|nr:hypothetical protein [Paenibacillus sp. FSL H7-0331]OMF10785.1 hypothetical protein BK127_26670 [Paenibacillus sp. FSL H7-0331]
MSSEIMTPLITNKTKTILKIIIVALITIAIATWVYYSFYHPYGITKKVVSNYIGAIQKMESTYSFKDSNIEDFENVLEYKFVSYHDFTLEYKRITYDRKMYDILEKNSGKSFSEFLTDVQKKNPGRIEKVNTNEVVVWLDQRFDEVKLVYDLVVTNKLGQKIYKKVLFTVNNSEGTFKIRNIYY